MTREALPNLMPDAPRVETSGEEKGRMQKIIDQIFASVSQGALSEIKFKKLAIINIFQRELIEHIAQKKKISFNEAAEYYIKKNLNKIFRRHIDHDHLVDNIN
jgi:predicted transcriptional regulator